jgi:hypothetical protein
VCSKLLYQGHLDTSMPSPILQQDGRPRKMASGDGRGWKSQDYGRMGGEVLLFSCLFCFSSSVRFFSGTNGQWVRRPHHPVYSGRGVGIWGCMHMSRPQSGRLRSEENKGKKQGGSSDRVCMVHTDIFIKRRPSLVTLWNNL